MPVRRERGPVLLACDLDGTLFDDDGLPLPGVGEAVAEIVGAGAHFVVVTGRPLRSARRATTLLGVEPVVYACFHGALIVEACGRILRHTPLPGRDARQVVRRALTEGVAVTVWDADGPREIEPVGGSHVPVARLVGDEVSRLVLHGEPGTVARLFTGLRREWRGRLQARSVRPGFLEVLAPQVDKGDALRFVTTALGVAGERTVACGDDAADESLLTAAAVRIAVGESPHPLAGIPEVIVTARGRLPDVLRAKVRSLR